MSSIRLAYLAGIAILVGFLLPITAHGDFFISNFNSALVLTDRLNFYSALADEPTAVYPTGLSGGPYGPVFYYPTAAWLWFLDLIHVIDVDTWQGSDGTSLQVATTILALKLPNFAVYLATAVVLARTVGGGVAGRSAAFLWLTSPATILFTLMMGQNDGWTALVSVAALYCGLRAIERRPVSFGPLHVPVNIGAIALLALGGAIKLSPIFLVAPFAWILGSTLKERVLLLAFGACLFLILVAPFLSTPYFWDYGLFGRQAGKATDMPIWAVLVLYLGFLTLCLNASRSSEQRRWTLLYCFLAFHLFFFVVGGWSPQRGVLFIAALATVVPYRPWFLLPYFSVSGYLLLLALEHGNELASGLFVPLTPNVMLIPPLVESSHLQPYHSLLFWLTFASWAAVLALWRRQTSFSAEQRWIAVLPFFVVALLPTYLVGSSALLSRGIDVSPYRSPGADVVLAPGDRFVFSFVSPHDDLRSITFMINAGDGLATVEVRGPSGSLLHRDQRDIVPGLNQVNLGRVAAAKGRYFEVEIIPTRQVDVAMVNVPSRLALASATLNNVPVPGTAAHRVHYETSWPRLIRTVIHQLVAQRLALLVGAGLSLAGFLALSLVIGETRTSRIPTSDENRMPNSRRVLEVP